MRKDLYYCVLKDVTHEDALLMDKNSMIYSIPDIYDSGRI